MPADFDSGAFLRQPAWHRLGNVVEEWPGTWEKARKLAGIEWEVEEIPLAIPYGGDIETFKTHWAPLPGYTMLRRSDVKLTRTSQIGDQEANPTAMLGVQPSSYHVIKNAEFGEVIEYVIGKVGDDWQYETLISLGGGRQIIAVLRARNPLRIGPDPSKTYPMICFMSRHDGQGGLKGIPTNIRVVCANTRNAAENQAKRDGVGFTIRHTSTWRERMGKAAQVIQDANRESKAWEAVANSIGRKRMVAPQLDRLLGSMFRTDSSMTDHEVATVVERRDAVRTILKSPTCEGISHTLLGFVQAVDEYADHVRPARNDETRTTRSLLRAEPLKSQALALVRAIG